MKKANERQIAGLIIKNRTPDQPASPDEEAPASDIESCAKDLISAVHANDAKGVADAMKAAFDILKSAPEADESNDFDAQNAKAAKMAQE